MGRQLLLIERNLDQLQLEKQKWGRERQFLLSFIKCGKLSAGEEIRPGGNGDKLTEKISLDKKINNSKVRTTDNNNNNNYGSTLYFDDVFNIPIMYYFQLWGWN